MLIVVISCFCSKCEYYVFIVIVTNAQDGWMDDIKGSVCVKVTCESETRNSQIMSSV